ncbi:MAG: response regulator [Armatimonadetes bacterium]|nr:response regulator [Armatimonadota bacterium]
MPVILLTSFLDPEGAIRALQCGADNLLARVYEEQALLSQLADILANLELRGCAPGQQSPEVVLAGKKRLLPPECGRQALDLLLSAYQVAVQRSLELRQAREALERQEEELERLRGRPAPSEVPLAAPEAPAPPAEGLASLRILLAEDSPVNQRLAVRTLEKRGHTVTVAGDGRQAIAAVERERFDLILMDVEMPEMGGIEATAAIRAGEQGTGAHVPIIAMTAHTEQEALDRCLAAGMDGYTTKPLKAEELFAAIGRMVSTPADGAGA